MSRQMMISQRLKGMPPNTTDTMISELRRLKIIPEDAIRDIEIAAQKGLETPEELGPILLAAGLTDFQTQVALAGQTSRLVFAGFVLLDKIGEGGMGVVYRALQSRIGRVEALKVIRADKLGSSTVAKRFLREIHLTSSLEHPHIVRAYDAGEVGEQLYLATEYVPGVDLATWVETHGPLSVADASRLVYQTTLALQHIHEKGLVHRDLKPSNLIRDRLTGSVKILDLGLSGFSQSVLEPGTGGTLTRDGVVLGTPDFMAPEQVQDPHNVDIRADLYSLGCTFYFLLTGELPFTGTPVEKMYFHGFSPPPALVLPGGVPTPSDLADVIAKLMAKKPEARFQTPQELLAALLGLHSDTPTGELITTSGVIVHSTPFEVKKPGGGDFDHLLSSTGSTASYVLPKVEEPRVEPTITMMSAITTVLFAFSTGFLASMLYFAKWLK